MEEKLILENEGIEEISVTLSEAQIKEAIRLYLHRFGFETIDQNYQIRVKTEKQNMGVFSRPIIRHFFSRATVRVKQMSPTQSTPKGNLKSLSRTKETPVTP